METFNYYDLLEALVGTFTNNHAFRKESLPWNGELKLESVQTVEEETNGVRAKNEIQIVDSDGKVLLKQFRNVFLNDFEHPQTGELVKASFTKERLSEEMKGLAINVIDTIVNKGIQNGNI